MITQDRKPLTGSALKWIAILTMLVDHIGACLIEVFIINGYGNSPLAGHFGWEKVMAWYSFDLVLRLIGRIAFPLFCFLLVEGAVHTRSMGKYMLRMSIFALVSEIPFDLAFHNVPFDLAFHNVPFYWESQNVYFTLLLGLAAIWLLQGWKEAKWKLPLGLVLPAAAAQVLHTDYGAVGVAVIVLMYLLREHPWIRAAVCMIVLIAFNPLEIPCILSFGLIALYNGRRGRQPRYFFYGFYPVHMLLLWAVGQYVLPALM